MRRFAEMLLQERERFRSQVRAGFDAEALHLRGRHRPDAMKFRDGSAAMKAGPISGVITNCPFGLR